MVELVTKRLILKEWREEDWPHSHRYASNPAAVRHMHFGPNSEEDSRAFIQKALAYQNEVPRLNYEFAAVLKESAEIIGGCGVRVEDAANRTASMGYIYAPEYWGKGLGTEAAGAMIDFAFQHMNMHRVYATCDPENTGSARIMEKCGMKKEAHFRKSMLIKGNWRDTLLYAILAEDRRKP